KPGGRLGGSIDTNGGIERHRADSSSAVHFGASWLGRRPAQPMSAFQVRRKVAAHPIGGGEGCQPTLRPPGHPPRTSLPGAARFRRTPGTPSVDDGAARSSKAAQREAGSRQSPAAKRRGLTRKPKETAIPSTTCPR